MEWYIECRITRTRGAKAEAVFHHEGVEIGAIQVDAQTQGTPDFAFVELIKRPHRWNVLPPELHEAFLVYRKETFGNVDYPDKTYRFVVANAARNLWKLTTDKSDIHSPEGS